MFIAGQVDPRASDQRPMTVEGEREPRSMEEEDTRFFGEIDPVSYFFTLQLQEFTNAILTNSTPPSSGEEGRETMKIIEGIYRSQREGGPIRY